MPRRNANASGRPFTHNATRRSIDVFKYIEENPTPVSMRRLTAAELPQKQTRKRQRKGGSQ